MSSCQSPNAGAVSKKTALDDFHDAPTVRDAVDKLASGDTWHGNIDRYYRMTKYVLTRAC